MAFKAILFDLDGTLLDTIGDLADGVNYALKKHGMPQRSEKEILSFVGNGVGRLVHLSVAENTDAETEKSCLADFREYYAAHLMNKTRPYDGIVEMLTQIKRRGFTVGIISNKFDAAVKRLSEYYFSGLADVAVGESEAVRRKPAPDCVFAALEHFGLTAEEAVYVGDSEVDIETAAAAGLDFIGVSWGFRGRELLERCGAKTVIDIPNEIFEVIL